ncbi:glycosyltransferase [Leucobacter coleopterorum]|uniref:Glycosyltransferase n=1 Tax=Leucobacter coleopterorum TaxID=2714933 RepID=A0ABX6JY99_9MICO|nr:CDP-glycerol glycerophosphotransferase family protein [Leucobacter coleopterorum]QIM19299.1 glycosyltransferase [Leucobacter coleopterorum]
MNSPEKQLLLSVVVPVYNVAQYLDQCLASVFQQGMSAGEFEVIVVDDGSTDGSALIAEKWAGRQPEVQIVSRTNGGLSAARNTGLDAAKGQYLTFLDSDDIVPDGVYARMLEVLSQSGSDFITAAPYRFSARNRHAKPFVRSEDLFQESRRGLTLDEHPEYLRDFTAWNKIYRRDFFVGSGVRFPEGRIFEDVATTPILYDKASAFDVLAEAGYFWRRTPGSITQSLSPTKAHDRLWALAHIQGHFAARGSSTRLNEELGFAIVDYNLRRIFFEYPKHDAETQRYIAEEVHKILGPVSDEAIARVPSPIAEWAMVAKHDDAAALEQALQAPTHRGPQRRARRWPAMKRSIRNALVYLVLRPALLWLPVMKKTAVFSSYWGKSFSPSFGPPAICLELNRQNPRFRSVVFATGAEQERIQAEVSRLAEHPHRIRVVRNTSLAYYCYLWRAKYLFNDVNFQLGFRTNQCTQKRRGQVEVQVTHGIPIKKMGLDSEFAVSAKGRAAFLARASRYDYLVSTSPFVAETFMKSHAVNVRVLATGLPQHDALVTPSQRDQSAAIRQRYGLDPEKRIVLYAPTFRNKKGSRFPCLLDVREMQRQLGDEYQFVMKVHPFNHTQMALIDFQELTDFASDPVSSPFVKLMGEVRVNPAYIPATLESEASRSRATVRKIGGSINELLSVSDVVVSDYSSLMFGYTHLRKPLVLFTPDIEHYNATRGSYFNVDEVAPGAVAKTTEELIEAIRLSSDLESWHNRYEPKRQEFVERFLLWEQGEASRKILEQLGLANFAA